MRAQQKFSKEYLEQSSKLSPQEILQFLEDFKNLHQKNRKVKTKLISIKVQEDLLHAFQTQCQLKGLKYQTQIKALMENWLKA